MKSIVMIIALLVYNGSYDKGQDLVKYQSDVNEQVISYQVEHESKTRKAVSYFIEMLNKYILRNNIEIMTEDYYIDFLSTF